MIHGGEVVSVWDTRRDAMQAGYEKFHLEPFMVQRIEKEERPGIMPSLFLPWRLERVNIGTTDAAVAEMEKSQVKYSPTANPCPTSQDT